MSTFSIFRRSGSGFTDTDDSNRSPMLGESVSMYERVSLIVHFLFDLGYLHVQCTCNKTTKRITFTCIRIHLDYYALGKKGQKIFQEQFASSSGY